MSKQVPFIGRENELAQIAELINEWGTLRILCIYASGGIGKTRLLQEVRQRYTTGKNEQSSFVVTQILDFDDRNLHVVQNFALKIAQMLDEQTFEPYLRAWHDWRKMQIGDVSPDLLSQQKSVVNQSFLDCFNKVSTQKRVVLFWDTTDALEGTDIWNYITGVTPHFKNTTVLIAGRNAKNVGNSLKVEQSRIVQIIELQPLEEDASEVYLKKKQELQHILFEPELAQKVLTLAQGRPILIDLAVEWRAREVPLDWLVESSIEELASLSDRSRYKEFEYQLIHHIADTRRPIDWLTLIMSRVYPLDVELICELLKISKDDAKRLFDEAQTYTYVKSLPDGRISLHDEMRRMVNDYIWPEVDPDNDRRRLDSKIVAEYYTCKISDISEKIKQIEVKEEMARQSKDAQAALTTFATRETLERELWVLKEQQLRHTLFESIDEGVEAFIRMFDEATEAYRFLPRGTLLVQIQQYVDQLSPEQKYEVDNRRVRFFLDGLEYFQANELATKILSQEDLLPDQRLDILIQRGNVEIRLGNFKKGLADFEEAVQISRTRNLQNWLVRALNARGWAYRNQGLLDLALKDYLEAYQLSLQLGDLRRTAWLLSNMGYVNAFKGNQREALENCWASLNLWQEMDYGRGIGASYCTLGEVYRRFDQPTEAMSFFNKALDIFMTENDIEWISNVRCGMASVYRSLGDLEKAKENLSWALKNGPRNLSPRIVYEQARVLWKEKKLEDAYQKFEELRKVSQEAGDYFHDYMGFADLIELAWEFGEYARWQEFRQELRVIHSGREGDEDFRMRGSCLRKIGDLAVCKGEYESALDIYKEGLTLIALYHFHIPYTIGEQLKITYSRIRKCSSSVVLNNLGRDLFDFWKAKPELMIKSPGVLTTFNQWIQDGEKLK